MLASMKLLQRTVIRVSIGCLFALAVSGPAFSQSLECPITSSTTVSEDTTLFLGGAPSCVVEGTGTLTVAANGGALLNTTGRGAPVTMIIDSGGELQNNDYFQNFATTSSAYLGSTVVNFGTIYNNANGTLDTTDGTLTNASNLENYGVIDDETGGGGTLNNAGRLVNEPNLFDTSLISVTTITNSAGGSILNASELDSTSFTNNGTLTNSDTTGGGMSIGTLTNNGTVVNQPDGSMYVNSLVNNGTFTNDSPTNFKTQTPGTLTLSGSLLNTGTLTNGGLITLASGATVSLTNAGSFSNAFGVLAVPATSTLNLSGNAIGTDFGILIVDGTLNSVPTVQVDFNASLIGAGTINSNVVDYGEVSPESGIVDGVYGGYLGTGTLTINGNYTEDGILAINLAGTAPGDYGVLDVSGLATLNGIISFDAAFLGFTPQAGDDFTFLYFGSLSGTFQTFDVAEYLNLPTGDTWELVYGAHSVSLDILGPSSGGGTGGTGNTPEPSSLLLLSAALLALIACSRAKRVCANA